MIVKIFVRCTALFGSLGMGVACTGDQNSHCKYWAKTGLCQIAVAYMNRNCCYSCATTASTCDGDKEGSCSFWTQKGYCEQGHKHAAFMKNSCCDSCARNGTQPPCLADRSGNCQYWARQGYCQIRFAYMNYTCCKTCQAGVKSTGDHCKPISASSPKDRAINIVLVPSAFMGNRILFEQKARMVVGEFAKYSPLDAGNIPSLNIWYVDIDMPDDDGKQCSMCGRLLVCGPMQKFSAHASFHCGQGFIMNTLIVHNSDIYGGAGVPSQGIAMTSTHELAPRIAVHEVAHSLFGLADEYSAASATPNLSSNCDNAGCSKWSDLQGRWGVGCVPGKCKDRQYYAAVHSIMDSLDAPFGAANERITCCKYLYHYGTPPSYCTKFSQFPLNLNTFCSTHVWKRQLLSLTSSVSTLPHNDTGPPPAFSSQVRTSYMMYASQDNQGQGFVYMQNPKQWTLMKTPGRDDWTCIQSNVQLDAGLYLQTQVFGEKIAQSSSSKVVTARIESGGGVARDISFSTEERIEVPPDKSAAVDIFEMVQMRNSLPVILNIGESCHVLTGAILLSLSQFSFNASVTLPPAPLFACAPTWPPVAVVNGSERHQISVYFVSLIVIWWASSVNLAGSIRLPIVTSR